MSQRFRLLQRGITLASQTGMGSQSALQGCISARSLLPHLQLGQQEQEAQPSAPWQQPWQAMGSIGVRYASTSSGKMASGSTEPSSYPDGADLTPPPEFFPLPEEGTSVLEATSAIHQAVEALERASIMGAKADAFFSASWCISALQSVHDTLGAPWWMSIAIFNITLRCLTFPLMVAAQKGSAKMMVLNYNLVHAKKLQENAMKATTQEEHQRLFTAFRQEYQAQVAKHGDPVKSALVVPGVMILNGGVFLSIFNGISKLMAAKVPSLTVGGALWFTDLTEADPYFGLPIMCTVVTLAMVEYGISLGGDTPMPAERQQMTKGLKWMLRGLAFMFIPAGSYVAAGTAVLWVSNTAFGVVQGLVLRNDGFRKRVGLPTMAELKEMNAMVMEANAASAPPKPTPGSPFSGADAGPAAAASRLLRNKPVTTARAVTPEVIRANPKRN